MSQTDLERAKNWSNDFGSYLNDDLSVEDIAVVERGIVDLLAAVRAEMAEKVAAAEADALEQARLNGMGSEREAKLMGRVAALQARVLELEGALRKAIDAAENWPGTSDGQLSEWRRVLGGGKIMKWSGKDPNEFPGHVGLIAGDETNHGLAYSAQCCCGWDGPRREEISEARADLTEHIKLRKLQP